MLIMKKMGIMADSKGSVVEVKFWVMLIFVFSSFFKILIMKKVSIMAGSRGSVMEVTFWASRATHQKPAASVPPEE